MEKDGIAAKQEGVRAASWGWREGDDTTQY
jgi:hypothetical protein